MVVFELVLFASTDITIRSKYRYSNYLLRIALREKTWQDAVSLSLSPHQIRCLPHPSINQSIKSSTLFFACPHAITPLPCFCSAAAACCFKVSTPTLLLLSLSISHHILPCPTLINSPFLNRQVASPPAPPPAATAQNPNTAPHPPRTPRLCTKKFLPPSPIRLI